MGKFILNRIIFHSLFYLYNHYFSTFKKIPFSITYVFISHSTYWQFKSLQTMIHDYTFDCFVICKSFPFYYNSTKVDVFENLKHLECQVNEPNESSSGHSLSKIAVSFCT